MGEEEIDTSQLVLTVQRGPPTAASGHAHLQIIKEGKAVGEVLAGGRDVTVLGRNSKMSHEVLEHQSISRRHAALVHNGDGDVFAADLGSTHGTYVNGCKIASKTATRLSDRDVLKFGESSRYETAVRSHPTKQLNSSAFNMLYCCTQQGSGVAISLVYALAMAAHIPQVATPRASWCNGVVQWC